MGAYQYQALKKSGTTCKGFLEADSERNARQQIRDQGMVPIKVFSVKKNIATKNKHKLTLENLSLITRQLATLLAAGIPVEEALQGVSEQNTIDKVRTIVIGVRSKVIEGYGLSHAMAEYPAAFPEFYHATVAAGEHAGQLDKVLLKLADYTENQQHIRSKIQQALIYPSLMIFVSTAIIIFLLAFVVPKIVNVFTDSGQTLPNMTKALIFISAGIKSYGLYILVFAISICIIFKKCLANPKFAKIYHNALLKIPLLSYLVIATNVSRFIHAFSILFGSGVSIIETMQAATRLVNNRIICNAFELATIHVREGTGISQALKDSAFFSPMALHLVSSGEKSGQLAPMMERAASQIDYEIKKIIDTVLTLLEPAIILMMGGIVLFIVLSILLPIFSMEQVTL